MESSATGRRLVGKLPGEPPWITCPSLPGAGSLSLRTPDASVLRRSGRSRGRWCRDEMASGCADIVGGTDVDAPDLAADLRL